MRVRDRIEPGLRKSQLINAAMDVARENHYKMLTRRMIADELDVAPSLVTHYLGPISDIKDLVVNKAIQREDLKILAQAIADEHYLTLKVSKELREKVRKKYYSC